MASGTRTGFYLGSLTITWLAGSVVATAILMAIRAQAGGNADPAELASVLAFFLIITLFFSLPFLVVLGILGGRYLAREPRGSVASSVMTALVFGMIAAVPLGLIGLVTTRDPKLFAIAAVSSLIYAAIAGWLIGRRQRARA